MRMARSSRASKLLIEGIKLVDSNQHSVLILDKARHQWCLRGWMLGPMLHQRWPRSYGGIWDIGLKTKSELVGVSERILGQECCGPVIGPRTSKLSALVTGCCGCGVVGE